MNIVEPKRVDLKNAKAVHFGAPDLWTNYVYRNEEREMEFPGKLWVKEMLGLTGAEISLSSMPPGASVPFNHTHSQNEELYVFLEGEGQMLLDGEMVDVSAGTIVRVDPLAVRCWRNTGTKNLIHLVIQVKANSLEQWTGTDGSMTDDGPKWA
ncbi:MAG: cupin domain-containing protein [Verrucomicrobiota bacterium]